MDRLLSKRSVFLTMTGTKRDWINKPVEFIQSGKNWWRWGSIVIAGIFVNFLLELTFGLIYKNYVLFTNAINYLQAIVLAYVVLSGIRNINKYLDLYFSWQQNSVKRFVFQALSNTSYVLFILIAVRFFLTTIGRLWGYTGFTRLLDESIMSFMAVTVIFIITVIDWGLYLLESWRNSLAEIERFRKERIEFQFEMLRNQVNPHFLFNSLNTASSLIYENQDAASKFVKQLAKVYRYVLEQQSKELVSLQEEKQFISSFIYLLELRFANNLKVDLTIPESYSSMLILPMGLQLLVENALKHNIVSAKKPLHLEIFVESGANDYLVVRNNLQRKTQTEYSSQLGLSNIVNRYAFITEFAVVIEETESTFTVKLPLLN
jgi:hypothetical protein